MTSRVLSTAIRPVASLAISRPAATAMAQRSFTGSTMALKHKESSGEFPFPVSFNRATSFHTSILPRPLTNQCLPGKLIGDGYEPEKHKQDLLSKHKLGKGHWKPELASDSEEAVKADRASASGAPKEDIATLQNRTKASAEETSKAGTSMRDGL
ncbi:hypothetical protein F5Y10DRAFT_210329 [Nemania abortiva]|nr:hypothetical protein F5Y10DRAFT_210329 [Nemania abortiva]